LITATVQMIVQLIIYWSEAQFSTANFSKSFEYNYFAKIKG